MDGILVATLRQRVTTNIDFSSSKISIKIAVASGLENLN